MGQLRAMRLILGAGLMLLLSHPAWAQTLKLGVLTDMSSIYADVSGAGGIEAAKMAVQDAQAQLGPWKVEIVSADHLGKADIGSETARKWFDQDGVDAIVGVPNSAVALAVQDIARQRQKLLMITGAASVDLTGKSCSPYTAHWTDDTFSLSSGAVRALLQAGKRTFFFITADYAYGTSIETEASRVIKAGGGTVVGSIRHPTNTADFSAYLIAAQSSHADVIVLANGGVDTVNAIKQSHEFNIVEHGQTVVVTGMFITDVNSLGLEAAQGLYLTTGFYWDRTDGTRAWSKRFFQVIGRMPTREQAETYSAVTHYLKGVVATQSKDATTVMGWMKSHAVDDFYAPGAILRADGRLLHPIYLARVKSPGESHYPWDYYQITGTLDPSQAFRSLADGGCPFMQAR